MRLRLQELHCEVDKPEAEKLEMGNLTSLWTDRQT
jgi:hypothetical protein